VTLDGAIGGPVLGPMWAFIVGNTRDSYERAAQQASEALGHDAASNAQQQGAAMAYDEIVSFTLDRLARLAESGS